MATKETNLTNKDKPKTPPPIPPKPLNYRKDRKQPPAPPPRRGSELSKFSTSSQDCTWQNEDFPNLAETMSPVNQEIFHQSKKTSPQTQQSPLQTQQPPPQTQQSPLQTQQPPPQTQQSPPQTQQSNLQTQQPPLQTQQPPLQIQQPPLQTQQPPLQTQQSTLQTQQPPLQTQQPPLQTQQPPLQTQQPPLQTQQPTLQTQQPPLQIQQPPLQTQQPPLQTQQPPLQKQQSPLLTKKPFVRNSQSFEFPGSPTSTHSPIIPNPGIPTARKKHLEVETVSQPMTIAKFLKQHGTSLPVLLKVSQGYESFLEKYSFGKDQLFVALEKKEIDLVICHDPHMKQIYEIPLDEELDVSPVLPDCFAEEGMHFVLSTRELLGCSTLPRAFCAMKPFKDSKGHLVEQGTLLFPHKAGHPLVAITEEKRKVYIDKSTVGEFSIKYSDTKMLLKEAVKYLKFPFACQLLAAEELDYYGTIVTFKKTLKGLVLKGVTTTEIGDITSSFQKLSVIPASSQIQVTIMETKETKILEDIYDNAKNVYKRLQPSSQPHIQEYQSLISDESDTKAPHHSRRMSVMASRPLPHIPLSADYRARSPSLPGPNTKLYPTKLRPLVRERMYESVQDIFVSANAPIISTFPNLKPELCQSAPSLLPDEEDSESAYEYVHLSEGESRLKNLQRLKELSDTEVLVLLEKMNLNQYRDTFEEEHIDGILLASLDNEMLEELGVTKSLHKLRLNKIIEGVQSVEKYFL